MFDTDRFYINKLEPSNADNNYLDWFDDEAIKKFILNHPSSISDLVSFINHCNTHDSILLLGIFSKKDRQHIGNIKFEFENDSKSHADMGILIGEVKWRGQGVASEVISESGLFLSKSFSTKEISLVVDINNVFAIKSYKKIGFKEDNKVEQTESSLSMIWHLAN